MKVFRPFMRQARMWRRKQNRALALSWREERELLANGWERVGEGGGNLWELNRGRRANWRIVDARISRDGVSLIIKAEPIE